MSNDTSTGLRLEVVAIDPPFAPEHHVLFGLQARYEVEEPVPATRTAAFALALQVIPAGVDRSWDFRGEHVHGPKGDRFLYLSWGLPDTGEPFVMFARAKIKLAGAPADLLARALADDATLVCELRTTTAAGQPVSGTVKASELAWSIAS